MEEMKGIVAKNLIYYRKLANLTQAELAEKLCYSDKSVSKWERGESLPDIVVLKQIADLYKISVDTIISDNDKKKRSVKSLLPLLKEKHTLITLMAIFLVWVVATVVFACIGMVIPDVENAWLSFIYALPVSFVVAFVFSEIWGNNLSRAITLSGLTWTLALALYLTISSVQIWLVFIIPIPIQVLIITWYVFRKKFSNNK